MRDLRWIEAERRIADRGGGKAQIGEARHEAEALGLRSRGHVEPVDAAGLGRQLVARVLERRVAHGAAGPAELRGAQGLARSRPLGAAIEALADATADRHVDAGVHVLDQRAVARHVDVIRTCDVVKVEVGAAEGRDAVEGLAARLAEEQSRGLI